MIQSLDTNFMSIYQMDASDPMAAGVVAAENSCVQLGLMDESVLQPMQAPQELLESVYESELQPIPHHTLQTLLETSMAQPAPLPSLATSHPQEAHPMHLHSVPQDPSHAEQQVHHSAAIAQHPLNPTRVEMASAHPTAAVQSSTGKIVSSHSKLDEIFDLVCNGGGSLPRPRSPFNPNRIKIKTEPTFDDSQSMQGSSDDAKHFCSLCNKFFSAERYYKQHYNSVHVHNGPKRYKCMLCQRSFHTEKALQKHIDHEVYKPFNCAECNRTFNRKPDFIRHSFVHRKAKPFTCMACHKSFIRADQLTSHHKNCTVSKVT